MNRSLPPLTRGAAFLTAAVTLALLVAGGLVTSTESGLSVPDWPLSFGTIFPRMEGGVRFEHTHRLIAGLVLLLTVVLTVLVLRSGVRTSIRRMTVLALAAVLLQALLGGLTVLLGLPRAVSISHAGLAQIFFALICAVATLSGPRRPRRPRAAPFPARLLLTATTAAVYAQILLGALVRHYGAGMAFPDFPLANGRLIPTLFTFGDAVNLAHRYGALLVVTLVIAAAIVARRTARLKTAAASLPALAAVQVTLGAYVVWHSLPVALTAAHVAVAGLLFAASACVTFASFDV